MVLIVLKYLKPKLPLKFYEDLSAFKLYLCDCGLMGAMADTAEKDVLLASGITHIYYYSSDSSRMEMDFLVQRDGALLPIEVKASKPPHCITILRSTLTCLPYVILCCLIVNKRISPTCRFMESFCVLNVV